MPSIKATTKAKYTILCLCKSYNHSNSTLKSKETQCLLDLTP
ncbi:hypothetical protein [Helicobacter canadensis]|nr:hypothetical protein [Helicobacter canadensis]EFR48446.1 hypothetical protein HCMG_00619 [Helicobacter canadensis MIT 98-5491]